MSLIQFSHAPYVMPIRDIADRKGNKAFYATVSRFTAGPARNEAVMAIKPKIITEPKARVKLLVRW